MNPSQEFNGKIYYLYPKAKYFTKSNKRLHRVVWEFYNGKIPKGYHIHHIDNDRTNNSIDNLQMIFGKHHISTHSKLFHSTNPDFARNNLAKHQDKCRKWHASKEGIEQHRKQAIEQGFGNLTYGERKCEICDSEFTAKTNHQRFCSNNCKSQFRRLSGIDDESRNCRNCGNEFVVNKYSLKKLCSLKCGVESRTKKV